MPSLAPPRRFSLNPEGSRLGKNSPPATILAMGNKEIADVDGKKIDEFTIMKQLYAKVYRLKTVRSKPMTIREIMMMPPEAHSGANTPSVLNAHHMHIHETTTGSTLRLQAQSNLLSQHQGESHTSSADLHPEEQEANMPKSLYLHGQSRNIEPAKTQQGPRPVYKLNTVNFMPNFGGNTKPETAASFNIHQWQLQHRGHTASITNDMTSNGTKPTTSYEFAQYNKSVMEKRRHTLTTQPSGANLKRDKNIMVKDDITSKRMSY